jgi:ketosteroid isomerase-like protein
MGTKMMVAAGLAASMLAGPALALDADDALAVVQRYDDAFNANDKAAASALCAPDAVIIDDFAPHVWRGPNACSVWWDALGAYDASQGIGDPSHVKIGTPWRNVITGDRAYIVVPATYDYMQHGKSVVEAGSIWTLVLRKTASGWLITGWAWGQH